MPTTSSPHRQPERLIGRLVEYVEGEGLDVKIQRGILGHYKRQGGATLFKVFRGNWKSEKTALRSRRLFNGRCWTDFFSLEGLLTDDTLRFVDTVVPSVRNTEISPWYTRSLAVARDLTDDFLERNYLAMKTRRIHRVSVWAPSWGVWR